MNWPGKYLMIIISVKCSIYKICNCKTTSIYCEICSYVILFDIEQLHVTSQVRR